MNDVVLEVEDLSRDYPTGEGTLHVLAGVSLAVKAGEVVGLVGPSGSGKSSLLHSIGLLERPTSGRVCINGMECGSLGDNERTRLRLTTIGFIYQFHHLLPELTAIENVALPALIAGRRSKDARGRAEQHGR